MPSYLGPTQLTPAQILSDAQSAGFSGSGLNTIAAIAEAESSGHTQAQQWGPWQNGVDRGIVQINSYYHPEVSNAQAFDPMQAFKAAYNISAGGTNFTPWSTFNSGAYKQDLGLFSNLNPVSARPTSATTATTTPSGTTTSPSPTSAATAPAGANLWYMIGGGILVVIGLWVVLQPDTGKLIADAIKTVGEAKP